MRIDCVIHIDPIIPHFDRINKPGLTVYFFPLLGKFGFSEKSSLSPKIFEPPSFLKCTSYHKVLAGQPHLHKKSREACC